MKKLNSFILAVACIGLLAYVSHAEGAKGFKTISLSASAVELCGGPAALYSVWISTAATTDFVVFRDSNTANTSSTAALVISPSATIAGGQQFTPPLQFKNGISVNQPASTMTTLISYECGKVTK